MNRILDISNKRNIKCETCSNYIDNKCNINNEPKNYWNRCKEHKFKQKYIDATLKFAKEEYQKDLEYDYSSHTNIFD